MNLTAKLLAAAWRENLAGLRDGPAPLPFTAREGPFNQLTVTAPPDLEPASALEAILGEPAPAHLTAELASAAAGHAIAAARGERRRRHFAALAGRVGAASLAALLAGCDTNADTTARLLETLATDGHQLHPCARTRLGWNETDFARFDVETPRPVQVRLLADTTGLLARSGTDFRDHAMLTGLDLPDPVLPVHPWQLEHRVLPRHRALFDTGRLRLLETTVPAWPTAAVRTVCGRTGPGHLKLALGVHITSTRRDISPATARLAPVLTGAVARLTDPGHTIAADQAGAWLPGSRDLTAIARAPLSEAAPPGTVVVPASALCTTSPVTGLALAAEYADWSGSPENWIRSYAALVVPPVLRLASYAGVGLETHLQNSLIAFDGPDPVHLITRDLGGVRMHPPDLPFAIDLPADSPVRAPARADVIAKVAYTLFQNQLAAIVEALARDCGLDTDRFWADLADLVASLDLPPGDRDAYLAERMPTKALLTMRLHPGTEVETWVDNPMHRRR